MFLSTLAIMAIAGAYSPTEAAFLSKVSSASDAYGFISREMAVAEPAIAPLTREQIRPSVLKYTLAWVTRTLREPYASKILASEWIAYPKASHVREPLTASASFADGSIKWSDTGGTIDLLIDLGSCPAPADPSKRKAWFLDILAKYLNLHDSPADQIFYLDRKDLDASTGLWGGVVLRGNTRGKNGRYSPIHSRWDSGLEVVTDGQLLLVRTTNLVDDDVKQDQRGFGGAPAKSRFDK
jgi:hypothetical protein